MTDINWAQPLEAVHEDGRVVDARIEDGASHPEDETYGIRCDDGRYMHVNEDGTRYSRYCDDGWTIRNKPAAAVAPEATVQEWGPAIEVGGVRPAWLAPGTEGMFENTPGHWLGDTSNLTGWGWSKTANEGKGCPVSIRLKANHPHYRTEKPAEAPLGVLTGVERVERLEALTARLAACDAASSGLALSGCIGDARALVAEKAPPIDPDLLKAREIALRHSCPAYYSESGTSFATNKGRFDNSAYMLAIVDAIKAGREMGK